ncbi:hypothetical protein [Streptantibioticus silvisoli]|uniref:PE-PGRS family protein n=1 Tax=Streptantibioticus silvisoli TaxID=2705255 RepID=A0ABT6W837_9ACTN|nr:hypothetical protein [Streptantibioticus silvisoli]MDI5965646.1 hypothetical protein [Streptantibioticus silvisoli]
MTTDTPIYRQAPLSGRREIVRARLSGRRDRALVVRDHEGVHHVRWPPRRQAVHPTLTPEAADTRSQAIRWTLPALLRRGGYDQAFHVDISDHPGALTVSLAEPYGPESATLRVVWWVHDPARVVRAQAAYPWDVVRTELGHHVDALSQRYESSGSVFGVAQARQELAAPRLVGDYGLVYQVTDVRPRDAGGEVLLGSSHGGGFPGIWSANRREEYDFCLRAIHSGPAALAALWLMNQPDQVSRVLDWVSLHDDVIQREQDWQHEMAGLLGRLSDEEQLELSVLVRDRLRGLGRRVPARPGRPVTSVNGSGGRPSDLTKRRPV